MDLDQLHTFLEIVRLKSFSKAAQSCYRTQPAVIAQVRQLEQEMNAPLFARLGTKIALTPAGEIFAQYAEQILDLRRRVDGGRTRAGCPIARSLPDSGLPAPGRRPVSGNAGGATARRAFVPKLSGRHLPGFGRRSGEGRPDRTGDV